MLLSSVWKIDNVKNNQHIALQQAKVALETKQKKPISIKKVDENIGDDENSDELPVNVLGVLYLPTIEGELPIIEGTNEEQLEYGVGYYTASSMPGENNQILLSGHRDTVFKRLGDLRVGDEVMIDVSYGSFVYKIVDTEVVDADDTTVIRSTYPEELLTISTCYPFRYIGNAPQRYIVYAKPVS
nr:class D sortase [Salirhabdus salicampi]